MSSVLSRAGYVYKYEAHLLFTSLYAGKACFKNKSRMIFSSDLENKPFLLVFSLYERIPQNN